MEHEAPAFCPFTISSVLPTKLNGEIHDVEKRVYVVLGKSSG